VATPPEEGSAASDAWGSGTWLAVVDWCGGGVSYGGGGVVLVEAAAAAAGGGAAAGAGAGAAWLRGCPLRLPDARARAVGRLVTGIATYRHHSNST